jgi:hypothetical protein
MHADEMDLAESFDGEEGATVDFPLSGTWWDSFFILLLAWEDCTGECAGATWTIWLIGGGGEGRDKLGQRRCWETVGWTISCHPSFSGTSGCNDT